MNRPVSSEAIFVSRHDMKQHFGEMK